MGFICSAETEGFEPSIRLPVYTLSKRARSTTLTGLRIFGRQMYTKFLVFKLDFNYCKI